MGKVLLVLIMVVSATFLSIAQTVTVAQDAPDVEVLNYEWGVTRRTVFDLSRRASAETSGRRGEQVPAGPIARSEIDPLTRRRRDMVEQVVVSHETYALVKNTGARNIKAIEWDYIFFADSRKQEERKRYNFRSKVKIAAGESKFLTKEVKDKSATAFQTVVIKRIEYDDGSAWADRGR